MSILNTSVSGMQANSNWLSSISQNVANADTTGYKNVETDFSSLVDQIANGNADFGGVSTTQVSLNALQGNVVSTSTPTDLAVQGAGFFVVSDSSGALYLTRNGSFTPDASGNLVNSAGYYLMAANVQNGVSPLAANSLTGLQKVNVVNAGQTATPTTSRHADRQSAIDRDAGGRRQSAVRQFSAARPIPKRRRLSSTIISAARTRSIFITPTPGRTPGRSTPSMRRKPPPAAAFPIRQARWRRRPHLQPDDGRAVLRLLAFDCGA